MGTATVIWVAADAGITTVGAEATITAGEDAIGRTRILEKPPRLGGFFVSGAVHRIVCCNAIICRGAFHAFAPERLTAANEAAMVA
jgi:hypothetical protein